MRELPILFSTPMVQAILENRKTMTRRTYGLENVNVAPHTWELNKVTQVKGEKWMHLMFEFQGVLGENDSMKVFPKFNIGDHIWVREIFFEARKWKKYPLFADSNEFIFKADKNAFIGEHKWKSSLFMPKEAARLWLEVTGVRCERLFSISQSDALAEGVEYIYDPDFIKYKQYEQNEFLLKYPRDSFLSLWRKINGKDSATQNPWVWVYEFKKIEKLNKNIMYTKRYSPTVKDEIMSMYRYMDGNCTVVYKGNIITHENVSEPSFLVIEQQSNKEEFDAFAEKCIKDLISELDLKLQIT